MNHRMVRYIVLLILKIEGVFLLFPALVGFIYAEYREALVYLIVAAVCFCIGHLGTKNKPKNTSIYKREGFAAVAICWVTLGLFGAIPFFAIGEIPNYVDALFEIVSGFTTTGSSILAEAEILSHASIFWRCLSIWMGGVGVLVFALIFMPVKDGSRMNLMIAESTGTDVSKLVPKVKSTSLLLYKIYIALGISNFIALMISGMKLFDNICITLSTAGTGGFTVYSSGCATYTAAQQWIITIFMILYGVNFSFYFLVLCKKLGSALKMEEVRTYFLIILASIAAITINVAHMYSSISDAIREVSFQIGATITTTGFGLADFNTWPAFSKTLLVVLMFCGACAGSTGGGLKVSRMIIIAKSVNREIYATLFPRRIKQIRLDGKVIDDHQRHLVSVYICAFATLFVISFIIISLDGFSFETNFTAVVATINNIGPGLDMVGTTGNFSSFSILSKIVLIFDMLAGRLEVFPMLILISPMLWREKSF